VNDLEQVLLVVVRLLATVLQPRLGLQVLVQVVQAVTESGGEAQRVEDRVEEAGVAQVGEGGDPRGQRPRRRVARVIAIHCSVLRAPP